MPKFNRQRRVLVLFALAITMVYVRVRSSPALLDGDRVSFRGVDAYYHSRHVEYAVQNWPRTLPYDVYTNFPRGNSPGQFGTAYDLAVATAAKFTPLSADLALFYAPVALAVATLVVVYRLARRLYDPTPAVLVAAVFALQPGIYLQRTLAGMSDHHAAETFLMAVSLLLVVRMLQTDSRQAIGYAVLAAGVTAVYVWVWPPGLFLAGIYAIGFWLALSHGILTDTQPRSIVPHVTFFIVLAALAVPLARPGATMLSVSTLHAAAPLAAAGVLTASYGLRSTTPRRYALTATTAGVVGAGGLYAVAPGRVLGLVARARRFLFFGGDGQIVETMGWTTAYSQLGLTPIHAVTFLYGASVLFAAVGAAYVYLRGRWTRDVRWLLGVWLVVLTSAAVTQLRFHYYFVLPVAVFAGGVFQGATDVLPSTRNGWHATGRVVLLVVLTLSVPLAQAEMQPGDREIEDWRPALEYLESETPTPTVDYMGTYEPTADFEYPDGSYGVLSWWDYGHYITVLGERPAVTNPHQQHAKTAAQYFLATNTSEASQYLDRLQEPDARVRYLVLDESMTDPESRLASITAYHPTVDLADLHQDGQYTERYNRSVLHELDAGATEQWTPVYDRRGVTIYHHTATASENTTFARP